MFDERIESNYLCRAGTSNQCVYTACPIVDGFLWSTPEEYAAIRFYTTENGEEQEVELSSVEVEAIKNSKMRIRCTTDDGDVYTILLSEKRIEVKGNTPHEWTLKLETAKGKSLPLKIGGDDALMGEQKGIPYGIVCLKGRMRQKGNAVLISPANNRLVLDCSQRSFKKQL